LQERTLKNANPSLKCENKMRIPLKKKKTSINTNTKKEVKRQSKIERVLMSENVMI
jgi:hypothetical protein